MNFQVSQKDADIIEVLTQVASAEGIEAYLVGGYVRDRILGRPSKDIDVVCVGDGLNYAKLFASAHPHAGKVNLFPNFGTAQVVVNDFEIEFVGARKESYRRNSRKPIVEDGTFLDDQERRDFTINTLAYSLEEHGEKQVIDTFSGIDDLHAQLIRTPLDPEITFSDDPLRMMRAIRFASQLGFSIEATTWEGLCKTKERISIISQERITDELNKIVLSPKPSVGFYMLDDAGLLDIILPELCKLKGVETKYGVGHKDNFHHTLEVLDNISEHTQDLWLRWAALLHDIAKPATKKFSETHGWTFHGHEVVGVHHTKKIFKKLKLPLDSTLRYVQKLVRLHLRPISLTNENITDSAIRRLLFDAGEDIDDLMILCRADITSKNPKKVQHYLNNYDLVASKLVEVEEKDKIRNWQPPLSGTQIMELFDIVPGRQVGIMKNSIKDAILDGIIANSEEAAINFLQENYPKPK